MGERKVEVPDEPNGSQVPADILLGYVRSSRDNLAYQVDFLNARIQVLEDQVADLMKEETS